MNDWQPMKDAPMNGTRMLLCDDRKRVFIGGYDPIWSGNMWVSENPKISPGFTPIGWQPLPEPMK